MQLKTFSPASQHNPFRRKRVLMLLNLIENILKNQPVCTILDVGGTRGFWQTWQDLLPMERLNVTCVNFNPSHADTHNVHSHVVVVQGDACNLSQYADNSFDLAFSNSVIEHVGSWDNMVKMAHHFRRVAQQYLIQTPYFWFPVEPHARTLFLHWLPESLRYRLLMKSRLGFWPKAKTIDEAMRTIQSASMLDRCQFESLFPDATFHHEKLAGFITKSLIAIKRA